MAIQVSQVGVETLVRLQATGRMSQEVVEILYQPAYPARMSQVAVELLVQIRYETSNERSVRVTGEAHSIAERSVRISGTAPFNPPPDPIPLPPVTPDPGGWTNHIKFGNNLRVTDEGNNVIRVDAACSKGVIEPTRKVEKLFVKLHDDDESTAVVEDYTFTFSVPPSFEGMTLTYAKSYVTEPSTSGPVIVDVYRHHPNPTYSGQSYFVVPMGVGENEYVSAPSIFATPLPLIAGDFISVKVTAAGTGAKGLGVRLKFGVTT